MGMSQGWVIASLAILCWPASAAESAGPVPTSEVVSKITVPDGFHATLFAGEPDVVQPIAMTTDARGRLWVVECLSYPEWTTNKLGEDRVVIFEDRNGDGRFDERKVFWDQGRNLTGIEVGLGGVWLCSLPELIFIPDRDGNDDPDSDPEVVLDGWDLESKHNAFNGLTWGPDGWLYGSNGILGNGHVGAPGTPDDQRVAINCGVWRYHPFTKKFEAVAHGTTNPWGVAFNEYGQAFVANCVIKHLFHMIPGGRYERMFGQDFNPYSFELLPSIANHIHWAGGYWDTEGADHPRNDAAGGGHAHSGAMIYQGGNWPAKYNGAFFTVNIHGRRVNHDSLVPNGSGYIGTHNPDFFRIDDPWFRGVAVVPSHDGGMYIADWSDAGECHDYEDIHRDNGRIYKVSYGTARTPGIDLSRARDEDLLANLGEQNEWVVTRSRLLLQERGRAGKLQPTTNLRLFRLIGQGDLHSRLRALWAYHATFGLSEARAIRLLRDPQPWLRAWTVRLGTENPPSPRFVAELVEIARTEPSEIVRLHLASALQRLPIEQRLELAIALAGHAEDSADPNIPLILWYGIEPLASGHDQQALQVLEKSRIPLVRRFIAQRMALRMALDGIANFLLKTPDARVQADLVQGIYAALNGRRDIQAPSRWDAVSRKLEKHADPLVRREAVGLSLIFGDESAMAPLKARAADTALPPADRIQALEGLAATRRPELLPLFQSLLQDTAVRLSAIKALAGYEDPAVARQILEEYPNLRDEEKTAAVGTLSSRALYARELLTAMDEGRIPSADVSPFTLRRIETYNSPEVQQLLTKLGSVRPVSGDKAATIQRLKQVLKPAVLEQANLQRGRKTFQQSCASCHVLFDEGNKLAPELTGAQRSNIDYLLENVVDPNAVVLDEYKTTFIETKDDRLISGVVTMENESAVTVQSPEGMVTIPVAEIASRSRSQLSLMPEGLFEALEEQELIDLIGYLQAPEQVSLPAE